MTVSPIKRLTSYSDKELTQQLKASKMWEKMDPTMHELIARLDRANEDNEVLIRRLEAIRMYVRKVIREAEFFFKDD